VDHIHICANSLLPDWTHPIGKLNPLQELPCLQLANLPFVTDGFCAGMRYATAYILNSVQSPLITSMQTVFELKEDGRWNCKFIALEWKEEVVRKDAEASSLMLRSQTSGFMCALVLYEQYKLWCNFYRLKEVDDDADGFTNEMIAMFQRLSEYSARAKGLGAWRKGRQDDKAKQLPFTTAMLDGSAFWMIQQLLYMLHDYRMLRSNDWSMCKTRFISGVLPWQVGWFESNPEVLKKVVAIFMSD